MRTCPTCERTYPDDTAFCPLDQTALPAPARVTDAELAGSLTRRYRIVKRLGEGGMGTVFLAEQIAVGNRPVALKVLLRKLLDDPEFLLRFRDEAASTGRIRHPNVVTIYESGQADDGTPYIAMEYLEGESLTRALKNRGALPLPECTEIVQQAARGLHAAHKLGIIHRDLKPDNIFLTRNEEGELLVKVVDFGIAKLVDSSHHTLTGVVLGTPAYMSAEHAAGMRGDELDARSDIYSLGIVAYEMLTGRVPFHADTPLGYVRKHVLEKPPRLASVRADLHLPPQLESVIMKALQKDRNLRYPSMPDFAREFVEAVQPPRPDSASATTLPSREMQTQAGARGTTKLPASPPLPASSRTWSSPPKSAELSAELPQKTQQRVTAAAPTLSRPVTPTRVQVKTQPIISPLGAITIIAGLALVAIAASLWYHRPGKAPAGMVYLPGGTFMMGCDREQDPRGSPPHLVTLGPFYIDTTAVTNAQYLEFVRATGYTPPPGWSQGRYPAGQDNWPVTSVSWTDAQGYAKWKGKRLPAEAEWEFAARGSDGRVYPWGSSFNPSLTNSSERGLKHPEPVGSHPDAASPFGALDMCGNVWQWCQDAYKPYAGNSKKLEKEIPPDAKVIRGGSFNSDRNNVTTATRNLDLPTKQSAEIGFRCAKSP